MSVKKKKVSKANPKEGPGRLLAKKDFVVSQNDFHLEIKEGDNLVDVPERFLENLKTEGVI